MRALISILVIVTMVHDARADVSAAARAFSEGQAAQLDGDYDRAAQDFELAYAIAPAKEALRSAIRARQLGSQLPRAATLAEVLLAQYGNDPESAKLANEVITAAKPVLARVAVTCTVQCSLAIGNRAISIAPARSHAVFANPGKLTIEISFAAGASVTRELSVAAGDEVRLAIEQPPVKAAVQAPVRPAKPQPHHGLSPVVPITTGVVALGLAGFGIWSGLDTVKAHDRYTAAPTPDGWTDGRSRQLRTNLLFGGAAAVGLGTALIATFWTRWHDTDEQLPVALIASPNGVTASFGGSF